MLWVLVYDQSQSYIVKSSEWHGVLHWPMNPNSRCLISALLGRSVGWSVGWTDCCVTVELIIYLMSSLVQAWLLGWEVSGLVGSWVEGMVGPLDVFHPLTHSSGDLSRLQSL